MKKSILLFSILFLITTISFCQEIMVSLNSDSVENTKSKKCITYFSREASNDSSIFFRDSILFYRNRISREDSKLELFNDSGFLLSYNIKLKTATKINDETGEMTKVTIQNSDEIVGRYSFLKIANYEKTDKSLKFILQDRKTYNFNILDKGNQIILIKSNDDN